MSTRSVSRTSINYALASAAASALLAMAPLPAIAQEPASVSAAAPAVDPETQAVAFIEGLIDAAAASLTDETVSESQRLGNFQAVLREALALSFLSKFMVGRTVYEDMDDNQRARYETIFPDYITRQYAEQFDGILGQPLEVSETIARRKDVFVRTQFIRNEGGPINVDWRTRAMPTGGLKVRDIIVNGASIMSVKRSEFAAVIERDGLDALIDLLAAEVAAGRRAVSDASDAAAEVTDADTTDSES